MPHVLTASAPILALAAITLSYVIACLVWPFKNCRRCEGSGKRPALFGGRAFRVCPRCGGNGRRLRTGRAAWNFAHRLHGEAHR